MTSPTPAGHDANERGADHHLELHKLQHAAIDSILARQEVVDRFMREMEQRVRGLERALQDFAYEHHGIAMNNLPLYACPGCQNTLSTSPWEEGRVCEHCIREREIDDEVADKREQAIEDSREPTDSIESGW